jgi:hypothetical protein
LEKSTLALNAAIAFFSVKIDPKCDKDCGTWRSLSNVSAQYACQSWKLISAATLRHARKTCVFAPTQACFPLPRVSSVWEPPLMEQVIKAKWLTIPLSLATALQRSRAW